MDIVSRLHGVSFDWIGTGENDMGLVAQDVEQVVPQVVKTDRATGMKSIKYASLIAPLVEAVKDLNRKNDNQSSRISELENEIAHLRKELGEVKERQK